MYRRHDEVPAYECRRAEVDARQFNRARIALNRLGKILRLPIPGLRHLDLLIQADAWIVVDRVLNDVPVVAWCAFEDDGRDALHAPVPCTLKSFHAHADEILERVLAAMETLLGESLLADLPADDSRVLRFPDEPA